MREVLQLQPAQHAPRGRTASDALSPGLPAPTRSAQARGWGKRGADAAHSILGVVGIVGSAERLTFDPTPQGFSGFLNSAPLPGCVAQTFPACISHFQARQLRPWDSPTCRRSRPSETRHVRT